MAITVTTIGPVPFSPTSIEASAVGTRHQILSLGSIYYLDTNNGNDSNNGLTPDGAFATMAVALAAMAFNDTLFVARGGYNGDFATLLDGVAAFTQIIGLNTSDRFYAPFLTSATSSEPILSVRARGMRITGLEFDGAALDASIELLRVFGASTHRPDGLELDHCLFTGGKFGVDQNVGSTYIHIHDCRFDLMSVSAGAGISATDTSTQLPANWRVERCEFSELVANIDMNATAPNHGFNSSIIGPDSVFQAKGQARDASPIIDIVGGAGNQVIKNHFGSPKSDSVASTALYEIGDDDRASGNTFTDGQQTADFAST